jgi:hypothetical protein
MRFIMSYQVFMTGTLCLCGAADLKYGEIALVYEGSLHTDENCVADKDLLREG